MNNNRLRIVIACVTLLALGLLVFITFDLNDSSSLDNFPEEGTNIDLSSEAYLVSSEDLLKELGSIASLKNYSRDVFIFGKTAYKNYAEYATDLMGFEITKVEKKNNELLITGRYGSSSNTISSTVIPLNHGRLKVSITDTKTSLNIDKLLPSNSDLQQFIGTLPIRNTNYEIDYFSDSDSFFINVFNTPNGNTEAEQVIKSAVGEEVFNSLDILRYGVGFGGGGSSLFGL
jgi:hypothetical protein